MELYSFHAYQFLINIHLRSTMKDMILWKKLYENLG